MSTNKTFVLPITNNQSLKIFDVKFGITDYVLVGFDKESAVLKEIIIEEEKAYFVFNEEKYLIEEFVTI